MATLPYPFLRRSRCGVPTEEGGLRSPADRTDVILLLASSAMPVTVVDAASPLEEVDLHFTTTTNVCEAKTVPTMQRTYFKLQACLYLCVHTIVNESLTKKQLCRRYDDREFEAAYDGGYPEHYARPVSPRYCRLSCLMKKALRCAGSSSCLRLPPE